ncbi:hypothetical protein KFE25_010170 [Diacronema lutheri]|uniref:Fucolectin tachylectin-4 pentraxin-1 domain-containing protein n=2 Tax=Diacronema lutheri TaxID=2081491 RepID=A0A8J5XIH4_DIALT|nr:hypothetical protein KFE25_010170 [Diacronema lutheri]
MATRHRPHGVLLACLLLSRVVWTRVVWTRVSGFIPDELTEISSAYHTVEDAKTACGRDADCGGFTFAAGADEHVPGAVTRVWFKRTSEWFPDASNDWKSYIKQRTACARFTYRTHESGLLCCEGDCPRDATELRALECAPPIASNDGVLPSCSTLYGQAVALSTADARSWPPVRAMNLARAGSASMSSAYSGGPASWSDAASANDHSIGPSSMVHTNCGPTEWWRVELPTDAEVCQVVISNRHEYGFRLLAFELQLLASDGALLLAKPFRSTANHSLFALDPPVRPVRHVQLRGSARQPQCLHVHEVQVIGRAHNGARERERVRALLGAPEHGERNEWAAVTASGRADPPRASLVDGRGPVAGDGAPGALWCTGVAAAAVAVLVAVQAWHMSSLLAARF